MKIYINSNFGRYFVKNLNKLNFEKMKITLSN